MTRRRLTALAAAAALLAPAAAAQTDRAARALARLERRAGGRLGFCALDPQTGALLAHRAQERFALCSTFKMPLAAFILRQCDRGRLNLDQRIAFTAADMLSFAPVMEARLASGGASLIEVAEAAQIASDNVAANLLLALLGGPAGFTAQLRDAGDAETRLDRREPDLNDVPPGDQRDTTTPRAMAALAARLLAGGLLLPRSRDLLASWMVATATGVRRLRAGLPEGWRAGDKTGTALFDAAPAKINDVAVVWPPGGAPVFLAAYYETPAPRARIEPADEAVLAQAGAIAASWVQRLRR